jgi:hypothetical protein
MIWEDHEFNEWQIEAKTTNERVNLGNKKTKSEHNKTRCINQSTCEEHQSVKNSG